MTDSELHEIENHISWGWHDDKGNDDVQLLFNEIMRLRAVAAEAREEGIEKVLRFFEEGEEETMWRPYEITDAIEQLKEKP